MSILIKDVLLDKTRTNVFIEGNKIAKIGGTSKAEFVIDGRQKAILPGLINCHTHAAMSLLRGFGDDMELHDWLQNKIWPAEKRYKEKHYRIGTELAVLEMIKTGTTCYADMYFHEDISAQVCNEMGIRAFLGETHIDFLGDKEFKQIKHIIKEIRAMKIERIQPTLAPHAIYTVSKENLAKLKELSMATNTLIQFHLAETRKENEDCFKQHKKRPVELLEEIGFLGENLLAAHSTWLTKGELRTLAKYNVKIVHNPIANMKLATGGIMPYPEMIETGLNVSLGTDGVASNNCLDMFQTMKFAALLQKCQRWQSTVLSAHECFKLATRNGAKSLGINTGEIREGMLADIILVDMKAVEMVPNYDLISNVVYAANGSCVSDVIIEGKIVMQNKKVKDEEKILEKAEKIVEDFKTS
ncbi:MAG: amidohydrolase [Candidatus Woesearchaeota archaeon]